MHNGWHKALEQLGHKVIVYNTNDRLSFYSQVHLPDYNAEPRPCGCDALRKSFEPHEAMLLAMQGLSHEIFTFGPEVIVFISGFYVTEQMFKVIRAHGIKTVIVHTESPYQDDEQLMRAQYATVNLLNDPVNLDDYRALVKNSHYMPHAYNPAVHYPKFVGRKETDFAFIGTIFKSRKEFFESMFSNLDMGEYRIALGGSGWDSDFMDGSPLLRHLGHPRDCCVNNEDTADIYRDTRCGINFYRRESEGEHVGEGWAIGPREVELAACGVPFLRDPRPESDELFPFLPAFVDSADAADKLRWMLADERRRVSLGRQARAAIADRTFLNNAKQLMTYLEGLCTEV